MNTGVLSKTHAKSIRKSTAVVEKSLNFLNFEKMSTDESGLPTESNISHNYTQAEFKHNLTYDIMPPYCLRARSRIRSLSFCFSMLLQNEACGW